MQNNIQHRITGFVNAYKRNRRWKILTIILSVAVLCNTFYAMRQAAVAVTENNGETSQISQIMENNQAGSGNAGDIVEVIPATATGEGQENSGNTNPGGTDAVTSEGGQGTTGGDNTNPGGGGSSIGGSTDGISAGITGTDGAGSTDTTVIPEGNVGDGASDNGGTEGGIDALVVPEGQEVVLPEDTELSGGDASIEADALASSEERAVEWITQETWVGKTKIEASYYNNYFENEVLLEAELISDDHWDETKRKDYEIIKKLVEEAAAESEVFDAEGFTVFDIRFRDMETWEEVEPFEGSQLEVSITTNSAETPDEVAEVLHIDKNFELEAMNAVVDEEASTVSFVTDSFSYYPIVTKANPSIADAITSAYPTYLILRDEEGRDVTTVRRNQPLSVEIAWDVANPSEIQTPGDYFDINLPQELSFPAGQSGQFYLDKNVTLSTGKTYYANRDVIATFTFDSLGRTLRVTYEEPAVELIKEGRLTPSYTLEQIRWAKITVEPVWVTTTSTSFRPVIEINGKTASYHSEIKVLPTRNARQLSDAKLTHFYINGKTRNADYPVTVGLEDTMSIEVGWEWKSATDALVPGDWFTILLDVDNSNADYAPIILRDRRYVLEDDYENEVQIDIYKTTVQVEGAYGSTRNERWVMKVTYTKIGSGYNQSSGRISTSAWLYNGDDFINQRLTISAKVQPNGNKLTRTVKAVKGSTIPDGIWRLRGTNAYRTDFTGTIKSIRSGRYSIYNGAGTPELFVLTEDNRDLKEVDPFTDPNKVDYNPATSNYLDTYCASPGRKAPTISFSSYGVVSKTDTFERCTVQEAQAFYAGSNEAWGNPNASEDLNNVMAVAFPYVSKEEMLRRLQSQGYAKDINLNSVSDDVAVSAAQIAIWETITGYDFYSTRPTVANDLADAMKQYKLSAPGTAQEYRFDGDPVIEYANGKTIVTGKLAPQPVDQSVTGTFSNLTGSRKEDVTFINRNNGSFRAELDGIVESDQYRLSFNGYQIAPGSVQVWYFINQNFINNPQSNNDMRQDLIAAVVDKQPFTLEWNSKNKRSIEIIKKWVDIDGTEIEAPVNASIEITVYRYVDGEAPAAWEVVTLNKENGFRWSRTGLSTKDSSGKTYRYEVKETGHVNADGFIFDGVNFTQSGNAYCYTATNKKTKEETKVSVIKKWEGLNSGDITAKEVVVVLKQLDEQGNRQAVPGYENTTWKLNGENNWSLTIDKLPKFHEDGKTLIQYVFEEVSIIVTDNGRDVTYQIGDTGVPFTVTIRTNPATANQTAQSTITNSYSRTNVKVIKTWSGMNDSEKARFSAQVQLFRINSNGSKSMVRVKDKKETTDQSGLVVTGTFSAKTDDTDSSDGEPVIFTLNADNHFTATIKGLPKYEEDGNTLISYIFKEVKVLAGDEDVTNQFSISYGPGEFKDRYQRLYAKPDMNEDLPTATITNTKEGSVVVIKKWINFDGTVWKAAFPQGVKVKLMAYDKTANKFLTDEELQKQMGTEPIEKTLMKPDWTQSWSLPAGSSKNWTFYVCEIGFVGGNIDNYDLIGASGKPTDKIMAVWNDAEKVYEVILNNRRKQTEIEFVKRDKKDTDHSGKLLSGAKFRLYSSSSEIPSDNSLTLIRSDIVSRADGTVKIDMLTIGVTYVLEEFDPPDGYHLITNEEKTIFRVTLKNGKNQLEVLENGKWVLRNNGDNTLLTVYNEPDTYELPEAGGTGTRGYITGGMSLIMATILMYSVVRMLQSRQAATSGTETAGYAKKRKRGASKYKGA